MYTVHHNTYYAVVNLNLTMHVLDVFQNFVYVNYRGERILCGFSVVPKPVGQGPQWGRHKSDVS